LKVKLGLPSNLFAKLSLENSLTRIWRLNPEAVELVLDKPHVKVRELEDGRRLEVRFREILGSLSPKKEISVHANFQEVNPPSLTALKRSKSLRIFEECLRISAEVEAKVLVAHPGWFPFMSRMPWIGGMIKKKAWAVLLDFMKNCLKLSENYGVPLGLENVHGKRSPFSLPHQASRLLETLEDLKFTFDLGHAYIEARERLKIARGEVERRIAGEMVRCLQGKLVHVHLHDNRGLKDNHLPPGEGEMDFNPLIEALKELNFQGQVILEIWNPENPETAGRKALKVARKILA
jgi:sugar phosphate isomerase/epimerase